MRLSGSKMRKIKKSIFRISVTLSATLSVCGGQANQEHLLVQSEGA